MSEGEALGCACIDFYTLRTPHCTHRSIPRLAGLSFTPLYHWWTNASTALQHNQPFAWPGFSAAGQAATSRVFARRDLHSALPLLLVQNWPRFGTLPRQKFPARKCISATIVTWSRRNNPKSNQLLAKRDARRGREQGSSAIEGRD